MTSNGSNGSNCKVCNKEFKFLLKHLARSENCKEKYTQEDYDVLKSNSSKIRARYMKEYYSNNSVTIKERQAKFNQENREVIRKRQAQYDSEHSEETRTKQARYNKENASLIRKKLSVRRKQGRANQSSSDRILAFKKAVIEGPNFVCKSCKRKLFKQSVKILNKEEVENLIKPLNANLLKRLNINALTIQGKTIFCHTCLNHIKKKKLPNIHFSNGLQLDKVPPVLSRLSELGHQMISRSLVFMKFKRLPRSRMRAVTDRVISVPLEANDISSTISKLPRNPKDAKIVAVKLKRKLELKRAHIEEYISPKDVLESVRELKSNGNFLYKDVEINQDFLSKEIESDSNLMDTNEETQLYEDSSDDDQETVMDAVKQYQSNQNSRTCLMPIDDSSRVVVNDNDKLKSIKSMNSDVSSIEIAPGEGKIPTNFVREEFIDARAFPRHHPTGRFGKDHPRDFSITDQMFFVQRLLNEDERFSRDPFYLFFACAYLERQFLERQIDISGYKGRSSRNDQGQCLVHLNDVFDVFKKIKGTPKFWQGSRNELIAKVKQLGPFHVFFTCSCGEMRWPEAFLSIFKRKGLSVEIPTDWTGSDEDLLVEGIPLWQFVNQMSESRHQLFKDYTFLITLIFDARVKSFVKNILMGPGRGKVPFSHYSYRVEFQARGMPHIHGVLWIEKEWLEEFGITGYLTDHPELAIKLADMIVSCSIPQDEDLASKVSQVQKHRHTKSCLKYNGTCR